MSDCPTDIGSGEHDYLRLMNILKLSDVDLHWREDGDPQGPAIVFANSLGTDLRLWDHVVPRLPAHLRLIRFDKRGHGLSSCPTGPYTMNDLARDAEGLLDALGVRQCLFVGLSIGGMIAQTLAAQRPDLVRSVVLSNTAARMGDATLWQERIRQIESAGMTGIVEAILQRWFAPAFLETDEAIAWRHLLERTPVCGYLACCQALADCDLHPLLPRIHQPVLGVAGSLDGSSPAALVKATIEQLADARFHCIDGAGHLPCVEKPDDFTRILKHFIEEIGHD